MFAPLSLLLALAPTATAQTPIQCCDEPQVREVVEAVAKLSEAFTMDKGSVDDRLAKLARAASNSDGLPEEEREVFGKVRTAARVATKRPDPRDSLGYLTRYALWLALRHEGGDLVIAEGWCADQGGWLQTDLDRLRSPWDGCGAWQ